MAEISRNARMRMGWHHHNMLRPCDDMFNLSLDNCCRANLLLRASSINAALFHSAAGLGTSLR
eukprot:6346966-Amphidinium_carterae.1